MYAGLPGGISGWVALRLRPTGFKDTPFDEIDGRLVYGPNIDGAASLAELEAKEAFYSEADQAETAKRAALVIETRRMEALRRRLQTRGVSFD